MNTGLEDSVFFKLVSVVNLTARPFQQRVGEQHQLTLNEWRAMAVIGARPGLTATQVADLTGLDKMAVSRALAGFSATSGCTVMRTRRTCAAAGST